MIGRTLKVFLNTRTVTVRVENHRRTTLTLCRAKERLPGRETLDRGGRGRYKGGPGVTGGETDLERRSPGTATKEPGYGKEGG